MNKLLILAALAVLVFGCTAFAGLEDADNLYKERKWEEAEAEYRKVLTELSGEEAADVQMKIARACGLQNNLEEAAEEYLKVKDIKDVPASAVAEAQFQVGVIYYRMGRDKYDDAVGALRKAQEMEGITDSLKALAQYYIGETLYRNRQYEESVEELRKFQEMKGAHVNTVATSQYFMGLAFQKMDKQDEAVEAMRKFLDMPTAKGWMKERASEFVEKASSKDSAE